MAILTARPSFLFAKGTKKKKTKFFTAVERSVVVAVAELRNQGDELHRDVTKETNALTTNYCVFSVFSM